MHPTGAREEGGGRRNHNGGQASSWLTFHIMVKNSRFILLELRHVPRSYHVK
jgi:hypothetical protein